MVDLTDKYVGKELRMAGHSGLLNPNYAFLINEIGNYDYFVLQGGTRSGKTWAVCDFIHDLTLGYKGMQINTVRQSRPVVSTTTLDTFKKAGNARDIYDGNLLNLTSLFYTKNDNTVSFIGADDEEKARGRESDILYCNEAPELPWEVFNQLDTRCKGKTIMDYNPSMPDSWVYNNILTQEKVALLKTTFADNPHITQKQLDKIEWARINDPDWYRVFGLGERGEVKGQIYSNWKRIADELFPRDANLFVVDFGFSQDPCCIAQFKIEGQTLWARECVYDLGVDNIDIMIHLFFLGVNANTTVIADSAEPKSISEIRNGRKYDPDFLYGRAAELGYEFRSTEHKNRLLKQVEEGYNVIGAIKGNDSIRSGIQKVQQYEVLLTDGSNGAWGEYSRYKWKEDRFTGKSTREAIDAFNHFCDCLRYAAQSVGRITF